MMRSQKCCSTLAKGFWAFGDHQTKDRAMTYQIEADWVTVLTEAETRVKSSGPDNQSTINEFLDTADKTRETLDNYRIKGEEDKNLNRWIEMLEAVLDDTEESDLSQDSIVKLSTCLSEIEEEAKEKSLIGFNKEQSG